MAHRRGCSTGLIACEQYLLSQPFTLATVQRGVMERGNARKESDLQVALLGWLSLVGVLLALCSRQCLLFNHYSIPLLRSQYSGGGKGGDWGDLHRIYVPPCSVVILAPGTFCNTVKHPLVPR